MLNFNGNQDRPLIRNQDLRYHPIPTSRSSQMGSVNPASILSSFSGLSLSSQSPSPSPSASPYMHQQQQQPSSYFDGGVTPGLLNSGEFFRHQMNYPAEFMIDQTDFNPFLETTERWVYPTGDQRNPYVVNPMRTAETQRNPQPDLYGMNQLRQTGMSGNQANRFYHNDSSSFLNNRRHQSGTLLDSNVQGPRVPCLYDFNLSDTGLGHGVTIGRAHQRQIRDINLPLRDLRGEIMLYAKDQSLCRILQDKFESPSPEDIEMVVSEVLEHLQDLMTDQYGNYLFQKLIKVCNEDQKSKIIWTLCSPTVQLLVICQNLHGSRSVQKLLECVNNAEHISLIISSLVPGTLDLATDPHGHHVLQQCFKLFSSEDNEKLIRAMAEKCFQIATNKSGCVVLHACVNECEGQAKTLILREIVANTLHLAEDPYGNYVVQHVLELKMPKVNESILRQLKGNFFSFSRSKFASNVVEKCLSETESGQAEAVIIELITDPNISLLLVDPFGNFVIQSAFIASQGHVQANFLNLIKRSLPTLRSNLYGKKIMQMLDKRKIRLI